MIQFLKTTWNKYKTLAWWKKLLLFLPLIALAVICLVLFFVRPINSDRLVEQVKYHKEQVDKQIAINDEKEDILKKQERVIAAKQKKIERKIISNQKQATKVIHDIDRAVKKNDLKELERLRQEINRM